MEFDHRQVCSLIDRQVIEISRLTSLQCFDIGDNRPTIFSGNLGRITGHGPHAVGDRVESLPEGLLADKLLVHVLGLDPCRAGYGDAG